MVLSLSSACCKRAKPLSPHTTVGCVKRSADAPAPGDAWCVGAALDAPYDYWDAIKNRKLLHFVNQRHRLATHRFAAANDSDFLAGFRLDVDGIDVERQQVGDFFAHLLLHRSQLRFLCEDDHIHVDHSIALPVQTNQGFVQEKAGIAALELRIGIGVSVAD